MKLIDMKPIFNEYGTITAITHRGYGGPDVVFVRLDGREVGTVLKIGKKWMFGAGVDWIYSRFDTKRDAVLALVECTQMGLSAWLDMNRNV